MLIANTDRVRLAHSAISAQCPVARTEASFAQRNRAVLLLGFAGAFRRSELVALNVEDLEETPEGLLVTIRRGKTDQEALGRKVAIPRARLPSLWKR